MTHQRNDSISIFFQATLRLTPFSKLVFHPVMFNTMVILLCYLNSILTFTQRSIRHRRSALVLHRFEGASEGDVSGLHLFRQFLVVHLLLHFMRNPELMLGRVPETSKDGNCISEASYRRFHKQTLCGINFTSGRSLYKESITHEKI